LPGVWKGTVYPLSVVRPTGSGIADERQTGQDTGDLLASIIRIDVDRPEVGKSYGIPKGQSVRQKTPGARPELWAYGLRQVWKFSFDRPTGDLWAGEVGPGLCGESVYKIERGGNLRLEHHPRGRIRFRPDRNKGPTPILKTGRRAPAFRFSARSPADSSIAGSKLKDPRRGLRLWGLRPPAKLLRCANDGKRVTMQQELVEHAVPRHYFQRRSRGPGSCTSSIS